LTDEEIIRAIEHAANQPKVMWDCAADAFAAIAPEIRRREAEARRRAFQEVIDMVTPKYDRPEYDENGDVEDAAIDRARGWWGAQHRIAREVRALMERNL